MEGEEIQGAVETESPAVSTEPTSQQTPAGAENTEQTAGQQPEKLAPFHTHPRFQQVIRENQQLKQAVGQIYQQMQQLQQASQQQGGLTTEQQQKQQSLNEAAKALKEIFGADPELKQVLDYIKNGQTTQRSLEAMQKAHFRSLEQGGVNRILQFTKDQGFPQDEKTLRSIVRHVQAEALEIPGARERFAQGDLSLIDEAIENAKPFFALLRREGQTHVLDTKTRTRSLPPASRGGAAGPAGLPKFNPDKDDPRAYQTALNKAATAMLSEKG